MRWWLFLNENEHAHQHSNQTPACRFSAATSLEITLFLQSFFLPYFFSHPPHHHVILFPRCFPSYEWPRCWRLIFLDSPVLAEKKTEMRAKVAKISSTLSQAAAMLAIFHYSLIGTEKVTWTGRARTVRTPSPFNSSAS